MREISLKLSRTATRAFCFSFGAGQNFFHSFSPSKVADGLARLSSQRHKWLERKWSCRNDLQLILCDRAGALEDRNAVNAPHHHCAALHCFEIGTLRLPLVMEEFLLDHGFGFD